MSNYIPNQFMTQPTHLSPLPVGKLEIGGFPLKCRSKPDDLAPY